MVERGYFHTFELETATLAGDGVTDIAVDPENNLIFASVTPRGLVILQPTP